MKWIDVAKDTEVLLSQFQSMPVRRGDLRVIYEEFINDRGDRTFNVVRDPIKYVKLCAYIRISKGTMPEAVRQSAKSAVELSFIAVLIDEGIRHKTTEDELHELVTLAMQILEEDNRLYIQQVTLNTN